MIDVRQITALHCTTVRLWHAQPIENTQRGFLHAVCEQHKYNFLLWHEEDIARSPQVSDAQIALVKRAIDGYNQRRNDAIELLDDRIRQQLDDEGVVPPAGAPWNSETPGSTIDRLSILALRMYHMQEQAERVDAPAEHVERARAKLVVLTAQLDDLSTALAGHLNDLWAGRRRLKLYRQMKMYNDPTMNPQIYNAIAKQKVRRVKRGA